MLNRIHIYVVLGVIAAISPYKGNEPRTDRDWFWAGVAVVGAIYVVFRAFIDSSSADSQKPAPVVVEGNPDPASTPVKVEEEE